MIVLSKWIVITQLFLTTTVAIHLTCDNVNPLVKSDVTCTCNRTSGSGIDWNLDNVFHSNCDLFSNCLPQLSGYKYSINSTENVFKLTIEGYSYSSCTNISCEDSSNGSIRQSAVPSSIIFDSTYPTNLIEPSSSHLNGTISASTGCISGFLDIKSTWYIIDADSSKEEEYFPQQTFDTSDTSACTSCSTDTNGKRTIGFKHKEASGSGTKDVYFKLVLSYGSTILPLNLTSDYIYTVTGNALVKGNGFKLPCRYIIIILMCVIRLYTVQILFYILNLEAEKENTKKCCAKLFPVLPFLGFFVYLKMKKCSFVSDWKTYTEMLKLTAMIISSLIFGPITFIALGFSSCKSIGAIIYLQKSLGCAYSLICYVCAFLGFIAICVDIWFLVKLIQDEVSDVLCVAGYIIYSIIFVSLVIAVIVSAFCGQIKVISDSAHCFDSGTEGDNKLREPKNAKLANARKKHQILVDEDEICCENCKKRKKSHASHAYCLSHGLYICLACLKEGHKQCVLLWNTGDKTKKNHNLCCNEKYKNEDLQLVGACETCQLFICSKCFVKHRDHVCTSHSQIHGQIDTVGHTCCLNIHSIYGGGPVEYCIDCKIYLCLKCLPQHIDHRLVNSPSENGDASSENDDEDSFADNIMCQCCEHQEGALIECLAIPERVFVCANCFEEGNLRRAGKRENKSKSASNSIMKEKGICCQVHTVLGGKVKNFPVEAYCLICKLYMCVGCFKEHRRIYDYWSKNLEGNLFYCYRCQTDTQMPVECYDLISKEFKCRKCYEIRSNVGKKISYTDKVTIQVHSLTGIGKQCELHTEPVINSNRLPAIGQKNTQPTPSSVVYCLVCKHFMCRSCFKKHANGGENNNQTTTL